MGAERGRRRGTGQVFVLQEVPHAAWWTVEGICRCFCRSGWWRDVGSDEKQASIYEDASGLEARIDAGEKV